MYLMSYSQAVIVKGVVKDEAGDLLPGAEILNLKNKKAVIADFNGEFIIDAEKGDPLEIKYLGYKPKVVNVNGKSLLVVLKPDVMGLDQVVVTGVSGEGSKKQLGSTIHVMKANQMGNREVTTITEALQGQISGAYITRNNGSPDGNISVRLRGPSTILGSSEPLIMIDGMIVNNEDRALSGMGSASQSALVDIDMEDIEKIEVLKGPAASAIYGSIASNGIVNIITKSGKVGKPKVSITSKYNMNVIRKYKPLNTVSLYKNTNTGNIEDLPASINNTKLGRYDWGKEYIFNKTSGYYNSVEVKGGTEMTKYLMSGSMLSNDGILRNTNFSRQNFRLKLNQKLNNKFSIEGSVIYANTKSIEIPFGNGWTANPMVAYLFGDNMVNPFPDEKGIYPVIKTLPGSDPHGGIKYLDYSGAGNQAWYGNPYEAIDRTDLEVNNNRVISNIVAILKPTSGFKIRYTLGYDYNANKQHFRLPYGFTSDRNGRISKLNSFTKILNTSIDASYSYALNKTIKATTGIGYNYLYRRLDSYSMAQNELPIFNNIQVLNGDNPVSNGIYERSLWGGYIQQVFNYDNKLFLTLAGRYDGASTFGKDQRNQFYPKISGSLVLSDFDFFEEALGKYINEFKIRAAYGEAGNLSVLDAPSRNYMYLGTLYTSGEYLGNTTYIPLKSDGNIDIRPERSKEFETGFDASFFNGKIGMEFTYYEQKINDLVLNRVLSPSTGFSNRYENVGSMTNQGIELMLKATPVQKNNFKWDLNASYSTNKNRTYNIPGYRVQLAGFGNTSVIEEGQPIGAFYLSYYATDNNGNWVLDTNGNPQAAKGHYEDLDGDGFAEAAIQDFDINGQPIGDPLKKIAGDPHPDFIASLGQTFTYKNFSLRVLLETVQGFSILSWDKRMSYKYPIGQFYGEELQLVKDGVKNPGWYGNRFYIFESFLEDGSFTKLREVSISYKFNPHIKQLKLIRFTFTGSNLLSWDNYWGMDPEVNYMGRSNIGRSQDFGGIPIPRVYSFTVNLKF